MDVASTDQLMRLAGQLGNALRGFTPGGENVDASASVFSCDVSIQSMTSRSLGYTTCSGLMTPRLCAHMVAFALGMLFWGLLSERFGRKPILYVGLAIYIAASLLCVLAFSIEALIAFRVLQKFAGGGVRVVGTTIVKDLFNGRERERIMARIMSLVLIAPMIAPVLGAFLLKIASWKAMFLALAFFGCCLTLLAALYRETLEEKSAGSLLSAWARLGIVLKNSPVRLSSDHFLAGSDEPDVLHRNRRLRLC